MSACISQLCPNLQVVMGLEGGGNSRDHSGVCVA